VRRGPAHVPGQMIPQGQAIGSRFGLGASEKNGNLAQARQNSVDFSRINFSVCGPHTSNKCQSFAGWI
ncbi:MAG: hypothetical protein AAB509_00500, partial [Patescibacteria group bacterium]